MQIIRNLNVGGAQEVVRTLAEYFPKCGCVPVVCTFQDGPLRGEMERNGICVEVVPDRRYSVVAFPLFLMDMLRIQRALANLVRKHNVQVVQTHLLRSMDFLVLTLRWTTNLNLIFWTFHNYNFELRGDHLRQHKWLLGPKRLLYRLLYRATARWVDGLIAVSDDVEKAVLETIGPLRGKIRVICNGVDVKRYGKTARRGKTRHKLGLSESDRLILTVGTLKRQKGHRYLIEAVTSILPRFPDLHIVFAGHGDLRGELETQVKHLALDGHVHFLGSRRDIPDLLAASDYFVLPSLWEGLPMALIEAMASGLPVIATDVSGTKQVVVHDRTGLLIPPGDIRQLRDAIILLLSQPARARAMGMAGRQHVETSFGAQGQVEELLALYRQTWNGAIC